MEGDEWVVHNFVLKATQIVIEGDDVFFEDNSTSQGDPTLVSLNAGAGNGEPFMQFFGLANECPHLVRAAIDEVAASDGTHRSKLTVRLDENGTQAIAQLIFDWPLSERARFACENGRDPKNPRWADRGEGCTEVITV